MIAGYNLGDNALAAIGRKIVPLISSSIEMIGKFAAVLWIVPKFGYFGVCIVEPILWVLCTIFLSGTF